MVLVAVRVAVPNGPKFIEALSLGTRELTFDLRRSKGMGQRGEEGSTGGGVQGVTWWLALSEGRVTGKGSLPAC